MHSNKSLAEMRFFDHGGTMAGIYPNENKFAHQHKKLVRMLTVGAYLLCVSLAAIVLSLYYLFLWKPHMGTNPDLRFTREHCQHYASRLREAENQLREKDDQILKLTQARSNQVISYPQFFHTRPMLKSLNEVQLQEMREPYMPPIQAPSSNEATASSASNPSSSQILHGVHTHQATGAQPLSPSELNLEASGVHRGAATPEVSPGNGRAPLELRLAAVSAVSAVGGLGQTEESSEGSVPGSTESQYDEPAATSSRHSSSSQSAAQENSQEILTYLDASMLNNSNTSSAEY